MIIWGTLAFPRLMSLWYEVYDNQDALLNARQRVRRITRRYGLAALLLLTTAPFLVLHLTVGPWLVLTAALLLAGSSLPMLHALRSLYNVAWCVKLSSEHLVVDYGRRRTSIAWDHITRVELDNGGLLLFARDASKTDQRLRVPHSFPRYPELSHGIVEYAESHGRPVYIDGRPWQLLDLYALYPFLQRAVREV